MVEPQGTDELPAASRQLFLEKVRQSNAACQNGDFATAVALYTDALQLDPTNHIIYSNRSAARLKQGLFSQALQDACSARDLCPTWPKAYYRQGVALQCMGRHGEALAAFSSGLAQDPASQQLLGALIEASVKSPLRHNLEPTFQQLELMKLDRSPFVLISVVGQELLAAGLYSSAVQVLESALRIGSCSQKLRGSVFSALSSAYWALNRLDKAISYMQQDLAIAKSLGDTSGECRAHGNLGSAYFSQGSYKEALTSHRYQLVLAMKCKDTQAAASALTSLGHVYTAIGDYPNALASHKQCVQLVKQIGDKLQEAREIGNVGAVYLAIGDFDSAVDCHTQHLRIARRLGNQIEEARAYSNLGSSHHYRRNFTQAIVYHEKVLRLAQIIGDKTVESRAYAGLGHASRCAGDYSQAKHWHERQLDVALGTRDKIGEGRACSNLGIVYQLLGDYDSALKLHQAHLAIARNLQDRAGMGRAYGNIGNAYSAAGYYESAIKYHKQELTISKEVHDRNSEASTHGNLAVAYQAIGAYDMALIHYRAHLGIARELKDTAGEACALLNLGNCLSSRNEFPEAIPFYEQYLMLSQELSDIEGEAKACHFLGYAHYCLGNYREAVRYYDQDLALAKDLQDKINMGRAYCNLGLAHSALGQLETALECQKYFLAVAHMTNDPNGKFRALGNIGDALVKMNEVDEAIKMYQRQLALARANRDRGMEASACSALGTAHRVLRKFDKALGFHTQELTLRQEMSELNGECKAHGNLGMVHMALGNYTHAIKCYQEQLERAQELQDSVIEAQAYGNLGIARLNMSHYEDSIGYFEQQLATLERLNNPTSQLDKGRAFGSLGDCYDALGDPEEASKCHEKYLNVAMKLKSARDQERAYRGLGNSHRTLGNLQQALVCLEKRLVVAHEIGNSESKAVAYGELGQLHAMLGNAEQAVSCLEHQRDIAVELSDKIMESEAISSLGSVYQQIGDFQKSLRHHQNDLEIAEQLGLPNLQSRACGNIGSIYESLGNYEQAIRYREQHLQVAASTNDQLAKTIAYSSLGRIHQVIGNSKQAVAYLTQGLCIAEVLGKRDEEARIRNRLGIALWKDGDSEGARKQLEIVANLLEAMRKEIKSDLVELQRSTYENLQKILIASNKKEDALVIAEKNRNLLSDLTNLITLDQIKDCVNRHRASVIYYSLTSGFLYSWLIIPNKGVVKFNSSEDSNSTEIIQKLIADTRNNLGCESNSEENQFFLNSEENPGFLRMVNRNHLTNSSNYSLSSLFSLGSVGGSVASLQGSTRSNTSTQGSRRLHNNTANKSRKAWKGPACLHALYRLLIEPFEEFLPTKINRKELILVLENDLYLVPFPVLRSSDDNSEYLCERFSLITIPSLSSLTNPITTGTNTSGSESFRALVIGNPKLPNSISDRFNFKEIPHSEQEAIMISELLQTQPLLGNRATKSTILAQISEAECIHFSTHISWNHPAAVVLTTEATSSNDEEEENGGEVSLGGAEVLPSMNEFLLTVEDFMEIKLSAKLVVISSSHTKDQNGWANSEGLNSLIKAILNAGARSVLISLWPVPETATKILLKAFYSSMLQGTRAARALAEAMQTVQHTKHFAHPANWAGFVLIGFNVRLSNKVALMGQALRELLKVPDRCRDALRVSLHLVEKSLQRIHRGQKNAMYTTQKSIENKVGSIQGWKELLMSVGFRFEPASNGIPSSVFFPQSDPDERLTQCSASLQALLALSGTSIQALSKLTSNPEAADEIINLIQSAGQISKSTENLSSSTIPKFQPNNNKLPTDSSESIQIELNVRLWRTPGCHELFASLGFDLSDVGQDKVTLRTGKQANRRNINFTLQALLALFDTQEAPKNLPIEETPPAAVASIPEVMQPPKPNSSSFVLTRGRSHGAFTSYVRRRGEPDGMISSLPTTSKLQKSVPFCRPGGGESDAAFTPSPPVENNSNNSNIAMGLVHQSRIRNLYSQELRPGSSSSASSVNFDWENGCNTVLRRSQAAPPIPPPRNHNNAINRDLPVYNNLNSNSSNSEGVNMSTLDRLSVRTEVNPNSSSSMKKPSQKSKITPILTTEENLSVIDERLLYFSPNDNQKSKENSELQKETKSTSNKLHDAILATQLRHINRELTPTISEVYHERNLGLGLAPPLSKILLPSPNSNSESHETGTSTTTNLGFLDKISLNGILSENDLTTEDLLEREWEQKGKKKESSSSKEDLLMGAELLKRDEGDGRSIADSNCSSSYKGTRFRTYHGKTSESSNGKKAKGGSGLGTMGQRKNKQGS